MSGLPFVGVLAVATWRGGYLIQWHGRRGNVAGEQCRLLEDDGPKPRVAFGIAGVDQFAITTHDEPSAIRAGAWAIDAFHGVIVIVPVAGSLKTMLSGEHVKLTSVNVAVGKALQWRG
jgi:hypothetical protein